MAEAKYEVPVAPSLRVSLSEIRNASLNALIIANVLKCQEQVDVNQKQFTSPR